MKKGLNKGTLGSIFKKVAIATFALAALFMLGTSAVYASDVQEQERGRIRTERDERVLLPSGIHDNRAEFEQERSGGRIRTEREERILLPSGIRESVAEQDRRAGRIRTERGERIFLPSGIREIRGEHDEMLCIRERLAELEIERSGNRTRTDRESRSIRNGLFRAN